MWKAKTGNMFFHILSEHMQLHNLPAWVWSKLTRQKTAVGNVSSKVYTLASKHDISSKRPILSRNEGQ